MQSVSSEYSVSPIFRQEEMITRREPEGSFSLVLDGPFALLAYYSRS